MSRRHLQKILGLGQHEENFTVWYQPQLCLPVFDRLEVSGLTRQLGNHVALTSTKQLCFKVHPTILRPFSRLPNSRPFICSFNTELLHLLPSAGRLLLLDITVGFCSHHSTGIYPSCHNPRRLQNSKIQSAILLFG